MTMTDIPTWQDIENAHEVVSEIVLETACWHASKLSEIYDSRIFLKREDRQRVRSYKIRGAYNKIQQRSKDFESLA